MKMVFNFTLFFLLTIICALHGCVDLNDAKPIFDLGIKFYNENNYDRAMECFRSDVTIRRYKPAESYYYMGNIYVEKNQLDEAIVAYEKSIGLKRKYSEAYYGLARAYSLKDMAPKAIENLGEAIDLKREWPIDLKRKWRDKARDDQAFSNIRDTTEFQRLLKK